MEKEERLRQKIAELEQEWKLLSEKLPRLKKDKILQTNTEEIVRLEHRIAEITAERQQVEQQLDELETQSPPKTKTGTGDSGSEQEEKTQDLGSSSSIPYKETESVSEKLCFVIMSFREKLRSVYKHGIRPAIVSEGLECIRADEIPGAGNVLSDIVQHIYKAKMIIVDLTGMSANVLYELGLAHALNNNVIMLAQNIEQNLPFDLNTYRVIRYEQDIDGVAQLKEDIQETIRCYDEWSQRPCTPVQTYLSRQTSLVTVAEHESVKQTLGITKQELRDTEVKLNEYKGLVEGLLGGMISGIEKMSAAEVQKRLDHKMDEEGKVTVVLSPSAQGEERIEFSKVDK